MEHLKPNESKLVLVHGVENGNIELKNFSSGSVIALKLMFNLSFGLREIYIYQKYINIFLYIQNIYK